jgi:hypothetical protein
MMLNFDVHHNFISLLRLCDTYLKSSNKFVYTNIYCYFWVIIFYMMLNANIQIVLL